MPRSDDRRNSLPARSGNTISGARAVRAVAQSGLNLDNYDETWARIKKDIAEHAKKMEGDSLAVTSSGNAVQANAPYPLKKRRF